MAAEAKVKTYTPQEAYNRTMHLIYELQAKVKALEAFRDRSFVYDAKTDTWVLRDV